MFDNVSKTPNQPAPNPSGQPKNWGPWKPIGGQPRGPAGPTPPPPLDQNPTPGIPPEASVKVPKNVNIPPGMPPDAPEPNRRKYIMITLMIFAVLVLLIAGTIFALNYFSETNENTNTDQTNVVLNTNAVTNVNSNTNANSNVNITNLQNIFNQNTNSSNSNINLNTNDANVNININGNTNSNDNTNVIVNSSTLDSDLDGLTDEQEEIYGTDPGNPDTDGDSFLDGNEVESGYNPLCNPDNSTNCNILL